MFQSSPTELYDRPKRQSETTEGVEGSGDAVELLVEQPKTGASLGEILGEGGIVTYLLIIIHYVRCCFFDNPYFLHLWNQLETFQDPPRYLCRGGTSLPQVQVDDTCQTNS